MSDPFDWQTDEDGWETPIVPQVETAVFRKPRWPIILVIITAVGALWFVVQWQVRESVQAATVNVEADLIAAHNFFRQTAVNNDQDLLKPLLSSRDLQWTKAQEALIDAGVVMDRPMFAWQLQNDPAPLTTDTITVNLNNQFDEAVLQIEHDYAVQTPAGITETVALVQTAVYRKGQTRWLYSPPLDPFWGDWQTNEEQRLTLVFPERDAEWGRRLAFDLDALIADVCRLDGLSCTDDLHLHLRLDKSPQSLLALTNPNYALTNTLRLELPTPTLVGVPVDEAGYTVLYRAYGEQVATAVITHLVNYDCCHWSRAYKALLDLQLAELDLKHEEISAEAYEALFTSDNLPGLSPLFVDIRSTRAATEQRLTGYTRALAHFLTEAAAPHQTIAGLQQTLPEGNTPQKWIDGNVIETYQGEQFMPHFWQFMYDHSISGQLTNLPVPLPTESIEMVCENLGGGSRAFLMDYNWQTAEWRQVYEHQWSGNGYGFIAPFWNGYDTISNIHLALSFDFSSTGEQLGARAVIIQDGVEQITIETDNNQSISSWLDPTLHYMYTYRFSSAGELQFSGLLDTQSCAAGACESWSILGRPYWSPNGQYVLMDDNTASAVDDADALSQSTVYLADERGQSAIPVGQGVAPFWIDNTLFGFVQPQEDGGNESLVLVDRATNEQTVLAETSDFLAAIPSAERPQTLFWQYRVYPEKAHEYSLIVLANEESDYHGRSYLFRVQWPKSNPENRQIELVYRAPDTSSYGFISQNGPWLTLIEWRTAGANTLLLVDLRNGRSQQFEAQSWSGSWSPDGNWLVYGRDNRLILYAPEYNVRRLVFHPYDSCNNMAWQQK